MCTFYELKSPKMQPLNISEHGFLSTGLLNFYAIDLGVKITDTYCAVGQYVDLGAQYSINC